MDTNRVISARQKFENIKRKWIEKWSKDLGNSKISLEVKCEINTGAVLFGLIDSDTSSQLTILESPANLASKLESVESTRLLLQAVTAQVSGAWM